jgi:hypothetical protein
MAICAASSHPFSEMPITSIILATDDMHLMQQFVI